MVKSAVKMKTQAAARVPQSRDEVAAAIAAIGRHQREMARIEAGLGDALAKVREHFEGDAQPHAEAVRALIIGVQTWCEAHRSELTGGGRVKTASFVSGEVRWRMTPPKVLIRAAEAVMQALRDRRLHRFIRTKEEPNKEAMLADPDALSGIPGIRFESSEMFEVLPFEATLAEVVS